MLKKFKLLKRTELRKSNILDYCVDTYELPNGSVEEYDIMLHNGAAAVVAVTDEGKIIMVSQYRPAFDRITTEIPAGKRDGDEDFEAAAARELEEETGYRAGRMRHLITVDTAIAYCNEKIEIYIADRLVKTEQHLDEDEFIEIREFSPEELKEKIFKAEIQDSKTIAAIMSYIAFISDNKE